ncbi:MAG: NDP-sugar synthase [Myxococcales bacterium]|nr:NDP-sugar synthase [Myxococcales bacterium]
MILAAGFGTRLGALSDERPKPLLPVGDVPLIRWALALLRGGGVGTAPDDVIVNLHHGGEKLERELGSEVTWSREPAILGTGGGLRRALPLLGDGPFVVANGKILLDLDLAEVLAAHRASGAAATLVVRPDAEARRWGAIDTPEAGGPIRALLGDGGFMFTGVHVLEPELVRRLPDDGEARCIVRHGYVPWLAAGVPLHAHVARGYFMEHSTPARYLEGNVNLLRGRAQLLHPPPLCAEVAPGLRIAPSARLAPTARLIAPVLVAADATIGADAIVGPDVVIGAGAAVRPGITLARAVLWPGATARASAVGAIVTPERTVFVDAP